MTLAHYPLGPAPACFSPCQSPLIAAMSLPAYSQSRLPRAQRSSLALFFCFLHPQISSHQTIWVYWAMLTCLLQGFLYLEYPCLPHLPIRHQFVKTPHQVTPTRAGKIRLCTCVCESPHHTPLGSCVSVSFSPARQ